MVPVMSLWIPIILSAVFVFVASSIIHMVFRYHRTDFGQVPREPEVMDSLRGFAIPPGDYIIPHAGSMKEMGEPDFIEKTGACRLHDGAPERANEDGEEPDTMVRVLNSRRSHRSLRDG